MVILYNCPGFTISITSKTSCECVVFFDRFRRITVLSLSPSRLFIICLENGKYVQQFIETCKHTCKAEAKELESQYLGGSSLFFKHSSLSCLVISLCSLQEQCSRPPEGHSKLFFGCWTAFHSVLRQDDPALLY